ncbi:hypothetical protein J2792_002649 [Novosphingobium capsulatum]|uniref:Uncharacterized protein n=1 Tax=Novosphingobium capsulatum TaxID=13688 RepID=A0ABU1MN50_9SPHN|nr:hypothetical protein [Novosphingobium capsulatum]
MPRGQVQRRLVGLRLVDPGLDPGGCFIPQCMPERNARDFHNDFTRSHEGTKKNAVFVPSWLCVGF